MKDKYRVKIIQWLMDYWDFVETEVELDSAGNWSLEDYTDGFILNHPFPFYLPVKTDDIQDHKLINFYNATSTDDGHGEIETQVAWLERQLLSRIKRIEELESNFDKIVKA